MVQENVLVDKQQTLARIIIINLESVLIFLNH